MPSPRRPVRWAPAPARTPTTAGFPMEASQALHWLFTFHNFNVFATVTGSSPDNPLVCFQCFTIRDGGEEARTHHWTPHRGDRRRKPISLLPRDGEQPEPPTCHGDETSGRPTVTAGQHRQRVTHEGFNKGADSSVEKGACFQQAEMEELSLV